MHLVKARAERARRLAGAMARGRQDYPRGHSTWKTYEALFARPVPARTLVVDTAVCESIVLHERLEVAPAVDGFQRGLETRHRCRTVHQAA